MVKRTIRLSCHRFAADQAQVWQPLQTNLGQPCEHSDKQVTLVSTDHCKNITSFVFSCRRMLRHLLMQHLVCDSPNTQLQPVIRTVKVQIVNAESSLVQISVVSRLNDADGNRQNRFVCTNVMYNYDLFHPTCCDE